MATTDELVKKAINHTSKNSNFLKMHIFFEATSESIQNYSKCRPIQEPCYQNYKKMCEKYGDDAMDYQEYEFWFMRFSRGEFDMDYDRSSEPEPLQFTDLPVDAVGLIVEKLEVVERLMLRRVSKPLQEFIEKQGIDCAFIEVSIGDDLIRVSFGNEDILYAKNDEAVKSYEKEYGVRGALILYEGDSEVCDDLTCFLKNPKLQLDYFEIWLMNSSDEAEVLSTFLTKFEYVLKSLKHQIAVRQLVFRPEHPDNFLAILPYLKPGYLEEILIDDTPEIFDWKSDDHSRKMEQIMELDQWKQARELVLLNSFHLFPDEVLVQFKKYWIGVSSLSEHQLAHIGLMFADSPIFEHCHFEFWDEDFAGLIDSIGVPGPPAEDYRSVRHLMIPNTDKLLVFKEFKYGDIVIEKKTRDDVQ